MAHYVKLDENNIVIDGIVLRDQDCFDANGNESEEVANAFIHSIELSGRWVKTSYNTFAGSHALGGTPFRKNYAGIGFTYDPFRDAFIPPKPEDSNNPNRYVLNEDKCIWIDTLRKEINLTVSRI